MIKHPTCFKSKERPTCIDLLLTNKKDCFFSTKTFEKGMSDHHVMIYTIFNPTFITLPPRKLKYRCKRHFSQEQFERDLAINLNNLTPVDTVAFKTIHNKHQPLKQKILRENNKPFITKEIRRIKTSEYCK